MRAFRYHAATPGTTPRVEEVAVPEPGPGELLVRVRRASLNPVDWKIATGSFRFLVRGGLPRTLGSDFSGEVVGLGESEAHAGVLIKLWVHKLRVYIRIGVSVQLLIRSRGIARVGPARSRPVRRSQVSIDRASHGMVCFKLVF